VAAHLSDTHVTFPVGNRPVGANASKPTPANPTSTVTARIGQIDLPGAMRGDDRRRQGLDIDFAADGRRDGGSPRRDHACYLELERNTTPHVMIETPDNRRPAIACCTKEHSPGTAMHPQ
jgi:hypothetical protein